MISSLTIKNFGLIDDLCLEFCGQLNILTGETGAGKSIIIDALRYALGEQLNSSQIRNPEIACMAEVVLEINKKELLGNPVIAEFLPDGETTLIINRTQLPDGKKKIKINGLSVTVSQLKVLGDHLVDFHGPNDHQMLLSQSSHLGILDRLLEMDGLKQDYSRHYKEYAETQAKLKSLQSAAESKDRELDMLQHAIKELERVPLEEAKFEQISQEKVRLNNVERLYEQASQLISLLENNDSGINDSLSQAFVPLKMLNKIDSSTEKFTEILTQIQDNSASLLSELHNYLESLSFEPQEAADINRNADIYDDILRKYGGSLEKAAEFYQNALTRRNLLANFEQNDLSLRQELTTQEEKLKEIAQKITRQRKKAGSLLDKTIEKELTDLGITHVEFESRIEKTQLNPDGADMVSFYISPNAGEALKPLAEIVSSGEAARLMLALKKALTKVDPIPVLIFDEIDAQIGGRLGTVIGKKLQEISCDRQVILITHLPQIASFADNHYKVYKTVKNNHTNTVVELLDKEARVKEMAQMMSGEKESSISLAHARDMLVKAK